MKKSTLIILFILVANFYAFCQELAKPSEGKSLVYFVRYSPTGALVNFKYFDGDKYLGKMNGTYYVVYECEPGPHVFWVASENRDFIKGELKANSTYIVEVRPTMGAVKAAVRLHPVAPENEKILKRVKKITSKKGPTELKGEGDEDMAFFIKNGLERYAKIENEVKEINPDWTF